jgi:6-hydroxytryprostatin B O-methyltransferase
MSFEQTNGVSKSRPGTASSLSNLSITIFENVNIVNQYLHENHLPQPTFEGSGPSTVLPVGSPQNVQQARQKLIAASLELAQLAIGPSEFLPNLATGVRL